MKSNMTYEAALAELNQLLEELEQPPGNIDQLGKRVKRAKELIQFCRNKLRDLAVEIEED
ncbi:MAG: exodeoxyribonuclease VII small subunit [Bacteroidota bacterium]